MDHRDIHALRILEEIEKNAGFTQRQLASQLDISLGLVNSFIKRLARKGYVKITTVPKNRLRYMLTPKGIAEKTRLTYEFIQYSFNFYKTARKRIQTVLGAVEQDGGRRVVFYGGGDLMEIAYISLQETQLSMVAIVDDDRSGQKLLGHTIRRSSILNSLDYDKIIITAVNSRDAIYQTLLKRGVPASKILGLE
jgi:DNA-binding MarR family transcriptional regulator